MDALALSMNDDPSAGNDRNHISTDDPGLQFHQPHQVQAQAQDQKEDKKPPLRTFKPQAFRQQWLQDPVFKGWLCQDEENPLKAYCNVCNFKFSACKKSCFLYHAKSSKHSKSMRNKTASVFGSNGESLPFTEYSPKKKMRIKKENPRERHISYFNMETIPDEKKCIYNFLGKSGIQVSNLCLGTMTMGEASAAGENIPGQCDEDESFKILNRFSDWGGNFIDTANVYGNGNSESIVGNWLESQERDKYIIATKVRFSMGPHINNQSLNRRHMIEAVNASLSRLKTDFIDLYQPHGWDDGTPVEEVLRTLDDLVRCGKIRYAGFCNTTGWQLQKIVSTSDKLGLNPVVSLQQQYSLASRESEWDPFQVCKNEGIAVLPWSPLKGGVFSGKIKRNQVPTEGRLGWVAENEKRKSQAGPAYSSLDDTVFNTIDVVEAIAKDKGVSVPQVALRWLLQKDVVTSVIIGARTLAQLDDNMSAANGWSLSEEEMGQLDEASARPLPYPYEMVFRMNGTRLNTRVRDSYVRSTS